MTTLAISGARACFAGVHTRCSGRDVNPVAELARTIDGADLGVVQAVGARPPVGLDAAPRVLAELIERHVPAIVLCLGLWPGEPMIRREHVALDRADCEIPDETGRMALDTMLQAVRTALVATARSRAPA